jgi:hypothetical protein
MIDVYVRGRINGAKAADAFNGLRLQRINKIRAFPNGDAGITRVRKGRGWNEEVKIIFAQPEPRLAQGVPDFRKAKAGGYHHIVPVGRQACPPEKHGANTRLPKNVGLFAASFDT